jgi:hypothetical protein
MTNIDALTSDRFETRRDAWREIITAGLPPLLLVHDYQIEDAANELADGHYDNADEALRAQGVKIETRTVVL